MRVTTPSRRVRKWAMLACWCEGISYNSDLSARHRAKIQIVGTERLRSLGSRPAREWIFDTVAEWAALVPAKWEKIVAAPREIHATTAELRESARRQNYGRPS